MTQSSLHPAQRRAIEVIKALGFGSIEHLEVRSGMPCFAPESRLVQSIKLTSVREGSSAHDTDDLTLKKEFAALFDQLNRLGDGVVDLEVRHGVPFRLVLERDLEALP